jgi:hypothetical protein
MIIYYYYLSTYEFLQYFLILYNLIYIYTNIIIMYILNQTVPATVAGAYSPGTWRSCRALRVVPLAKVRSPGSWNAGKTIGKSWAKIHQLVLSFGTLPVIRSWVMESALQLAASMGTSNIYIYIDGWFPLASYSYGSNTSYSISQWNDPTKMEW